MDSELKHELQQNDLAEFLTNFGGWWNKNGTTVLAVVALAAAVFLGQKWVKTRAYQNHETAWADLAGSTSPESYRLTAETHDDATVKALAYLRGADLLLATAYQDADSDAPGDEAAANQATSPMQRSPEETLAEAATMYRGVLDNADAHAVLKLNARLGAASVAENLEQWDTARQHYQAVLEGAGPGYEALAEQATTRLGLIDQVSKTVNFPEGKPETAGATPDPGPEGPASSLEGESVDQADNAVGEAAASTQPAGL